MPKYRALFGLMYPTDARILRRLANGENIPIPERRMKKVAAGDVVDDIPQVSIAGLLEAGRIEIVDEPKEPD